MIKTIAEAMGIDPKEIINDLLAHGAPPTVCNGSSLDDDIAKIIGIQYCYYIEEPTSSQSDS
jgi:hypothetical protein